MHHFLFRWRSSAFALALFSFLAGCAGPEQPSIEALTLDATGAWRHNGTGLVFPSRVAGFHREMAGALDHKGEAFKVRYRCDLPMGHGVTRFVRAAIEVSSAGQLSMEAEMAHLKSAVEAALPGSVLAEQGEAPPFFTSDAVAGPYARYSTDLNRVLPMESARATEILLYRRRGYFVKVEFSYWDDFRAQSQELSRAFLAALRKSGGL